MSELETTVRQPSDSPRPADVVWGKGFCHQCPSQDCWGVAYSVPRHAATGVVALCWRCLLSGLLVTMQGIARRDRTELAEQVLTCLCRLADELVELRHEYEVGDWASDLEGIQHQLYSLAKKAGVELTEEGG